MKKSVQQLTQLNVTDLLKKTIDYTNCQSTEFNKYEALDLIENLQNTAHDTNHDKKDYYRLAFQTARSKVDMPLEFFKSLMLRLLGYVYCNKPGHTWAKGMSRKLQQPKTPSTATSTQATPLDLSRPT